MNIKKTIGTLMMCAISATPMMAQQTCAESYQPCTYQEMEQLTDRKSTRLNSSHCSESRMPSSA